MHRPFILGLLLCLSVLAARSQARFAIAAGYENMTAVVNKQNVPSGGFAGSFTVELPLANRLELDMGMSIGSWRKRFTYSAFFPGGPRGSIAPAIYDTVNSDFKLMHILFPIHLSYIIPVGNVSLLAGIGFYISAIPIEGQAQPTNMISGGGISFKGGIRWHRHLLLMAEFRPIVNNGFDNHVLYTQYAVYALKNDYSFKIGYEISKSRRRK